MNHTRHSFFQKIIAAFLLCLLGFIYTGKAFHHHENKVTGHLHAVVAETSKSTDCSICEFQLAKAPGLPLLPQVQRPVIPVANVYGYTLINFLSAPLTDIPARGPPVC